MRLATFNFLHGGSAKRSSHWRDLLERVEPDIVFCQEACPATTRSPGTLHWQSVRGVKWGSGVWLRKHKAEPVSIRGFDGWVTAVRIAKPDALLVSVHCPAGTKGYIDSMHRILDAVARKARGFDVIIAGDLNVAAGYRDNGDNVPMSKHERAILDRMKNELGLHSCWQSANPGIPLAQTLRWMRNPATPYHCDGIFVPEQWITRLKSCTVLNAETWTALSDHNPVVADFFTTLKRPVMRIVDPSRPRSSYR